MANFFFANVSNLNILLRYNHPLIRKTKTNTLLLQSVLRHHRWHSCSLEPEASNGGLQRLAVPYHKSTINPSGAELGDAISRHTIGEDLGDGILVSAGDGRVAGAFLGTLIQTFELCHSTAREQKCMKVGIRWNESQLSSPDMFTSRLLFLLVQLVDVGEAVVVVMAPEDGKTVVSRGNEAVFSGPHAGQIWKILVLHNSQTVIERLP